jgi:hypothetical protein
MKTYLRLRKLYKSIKTEYDTKKYALETVRNDLRYKLKETEEKLRLLNHPYWMTLIVEPLAIEIAKHFPGYRHEVLGPFGIGAKVSIHLYPNKAYEAYNSRDTADSLSGKEAYREMMDGCKSITFSPRCCNESIGLAIVDRSVNTGEYPKGTIGEMNGFNHPEIEVPKDATIQWFVDRINNSRTLVKGEET